MYFRYNLGQGLATFQRCRAEPMLKVIPHANIILKFYILRRPLCTMCYLGSWAATQIPTLSS